MKGSRFLRFVIPLIDVLKSLGGSATSSEATDAVIEKCNISEAEQEIILKSGQSRVYNDIAWVRMYLVKAGLMDSSKHGVWGLTPKGHESNLSEEDVYRLFKDVQKRTAEQRKAKKKTTKDKKPDQIAPIDPQSADTTETDFRTDLLETLKALSPDGFERLSGLLLRESGFEEVTVTGKSDDGGIDGHGVLRVNSFVSTKVLFQCKRFKGSVSASQVRDFRGAMLGRTDNGIIITTGTFTVKAKQEAKREGVPQLRLVDGEQLVQQFIDLELGVKPRKTYDIDYDFFEEYKPKEESSEVAGGQNN